MTAGTDPAAAAPLVGVVMGSSSDWEVMRHAVAVLRGRPTEHSPGAPAPDPGAPEGNG